MRGAAFTFSPDDGSAAFSLVEILWRATERVLEEVGR